jgi:hypothetical protein
MENFEGCCQRSVKTVRKAKRAEKQKMDFERAITIQHDLTRKRFRFQL